MMGDCVTPRHSAVMERLRRRIELFRQHHNSCESRYERASLERLELDRQQTYALHQRCLQAKAKRSSKQRQSQPSGGEAPGGRGPEGAEGAEQSRNTTLAALQETVKRKIERAGSPMGRDQVNGYGDAFHPSKKQCLDNSATNGSPLDSKLGLTDAISANGKHESTEDTAGDFHPKELKQEPDDILPIMPPSGGGSTAGSLFPDLNLNEQEWSELMEELNCTVAYEDIQDILNDDDPLELTPAPVPEPPPGGGGAQPATGGAPPGGVGAGRQATPGHLPPDLSTVKSEFSPASLDSHSPLVNVRSSVTSSLPPSSLPPAAPSVAPPSSTSPVLHSQSQSSRPLQNHLLPSKDLSPAQQLQQLAAQQRHLHEALQHKQNPPGAKFHPQSQHPHPQAQHPHPPAWMGGTAQSPITGGFSMDKPSSPSLYQQDMMFSTNQNQLLLPSQAGKGSPKAGTFLQGGSSVMGHSLGHPPAPPQQQQQQPGAQLNFNNTKPLSHYEARGPSSDQSKAQLMTLIRHQQQQQQQQQHLKQKAMGYRPHLQHPQDQNNFGASTLQQQQQQQQQQPGPGPPGMGANPAIANHGNPAAAAAAMGGSAAYMNSQQVAAALKQQQQRQQQQYLQRQQMMEQEKQRQQQQQDQQLKRHLSRPPPQYQDMSSQSPNQNFTQQQFTGSSAPMGGVASMGPTNPASRMFPPPQRMMGMGGNSVAPPTNNQAPLQPQAQPDMLTANGMYSAPGLSQQQRQQQLYRQNLMMKTQSNAAMLKQQQQLGVRLPGQMGPNMSAAMNSTHQAPQNVTWSQQMASQQLANHSAQMPSTPLANQQMHGSFANAAPNAFHLQQQRLPKLQPFNANRPLNAMTPGQQLMQRPPTSLGQQGAPQPDLSTFGQGAAGRNVAATGLQCNYGVGRAGGAPQPPQPPQQQQQQQQQQQLSCGYNVAAGSFAEESELVDSLLKAQSTQEWMDDLDELLARHP